ncbi:hypothetical protein BDC45DRAFT_574159 [Circinella umbellata]|nr:hypothetical protein BDC45DRAFT_574159 [Circinella umbellata]
MFAGHFGIIHILQYWFPGTSIYVLSFGVVFIDIIHSILAYYSIETFTRNTNAGFVGVDVHCDYSHSLLGQLLLSFIYGVFTRTKTKKKSIIPGFVASFSHFILDWLVHNSDLTLGPPPFLNDYIVGGTGLWATYPETAFYFEGLLCIFCTILYSHRDISKGRSLLVIVLIAMHVQFRLMSPSLLNYIFAIDDLVKRHHTVGVMFFLSFVIPALLFGFLLNQNNLLEKKNINL